MKKKPINILQSWQVKQRQSLSLVDKIKLSTRRITSFYEHNDGCVYVGFSGGKDSVVLLHLVRSIYPDVIGIFSNTGLEFPEIVKFVKTFNNIQIIKPKKSFKYVIDKYGIPFPSKEQSEMIYRYKHSKNQNVKNKLLIGRGEKKKFKISKKYYKLLESNIKISNKCCDILKKNPFKIYEKETKNKPYLGMRADESMLRLSDYMRFGCNPNNNKSQPLMFWTEKDIVNILPIII